MRFSENFLRDVRWYFHMRHQFNFDGRPHREIVFDRCATTGLQAFHAFDSRGVLQSTRHPNILRTLIKTKGSVNFHIKMYAEDRASGLLPLPELRQLCQQWNAPTWFITAVENQKCKILI